MSCDVGKATEELENDPWRRWSDGKLWSFSNLSVASPTSQLILQPFRRFTYVTAHSPILPLLHLRHSSFSNPSFASPTSQALHLTSPREASINGKREEGSRRKKISDDRQQHDKGTVCRYEKEDWEGRVENDEFAVKGLPLGRTLHYDWLLLTKTLYTFPDYFIRATYPAHLRRVASV